MTSAAFDQAGRTTISTTLGLSTSAIQMGTPGPSSRYPVGVSAELQLKPDLSSTRDPRTWRHVLREMRRKKSSRPDPREGPQGRLHGPSRPRVEASCALTPACPRRLPTTEQPR